MYVNLGCRDRVLLDGNAGRVEHDNRIPTADDSVPRLALVASAIERDVGGACDDSGSAHLGFGRVGGIASTVRRGDTQPTDLHFFTGFDIEASNAPASTSGAG